MQSNLPYCTHASARANDTSQQFIRINKPITYFFMFGHFELSLMWNEICNCHGKNHSYIRLLRRIRRRRRRKKKTTFKRWSSMVRKIVLYTCHFCHIIRANLLIKYGLKTKFVTWGELNYLTYEGIQSHTHILCSTLDNNAISFAWFEKENIENNEKKNVYW